MRKRTSSIWITSKEELVNIVKSSESLSNVLKKINLDPTRSGSRYRSLKDRLKQDNIDYSHISLGNFSNQGRKFPSQAKPLEEVMVENSTYSRGFLKKRLLKNGMLKNQCAICEQLPFFNNKELVMVLDHTNGIRNDNRRENLRLLCPNCNSQQETFAGKRNKKFFPKCKNCGGTNVSRKSKTQLCKDCYNLFHIARKVKNRPTVNLLLKEIKETNYSAVGRKYKVSRTTIKRWIK